MLRIPNGVRVYASIAPQDMRKQAYGLASVVSAAMQRDPKAGDLFLFVGRRRNLLKALFHDGQGFVLLTKRLDGGCFRWITGEGTIDLDGHALARILTDVRQKGESCAARRKKPI